IGVLDAKVTLTTRGDPELIARSVVRAMPRTSLKDFVSAIAAANAIDGEISEPDTTDPADVSSPFRITFRQRLSGALDWAAARSQLKIGERVKLPYADEADGKDLHRLRFDLSTSRERVSIELP